MRNSSTMRHKKKGLVEHRDPPLRLIVPISAWPRNRIGTTFINPASKTGYTGGLLMSGNRSWRGLSVQ